MDKEFSKYDIVKFTDGGFELEVNVSPSEETVWLSQEQLAVLFDSTKQNISLHISNILREGELDYGTVKEILTVQNEGNRTVSRKIRVYNLDMIISVGFRLKSRRGIVFRQWANRILRQFMLKGYAIDASRTVVTKENYLDLVNVVNRIDSTQERLVSRIEKLENRYNEKDNRVFFNGQLWDATSCIEGIIGKAKKTIILIDGYVDKSTLDMLSRKSDGVTVEIHTSPGNYRLTEKEIRSFESQYGKLLISFSDEFHDRFLILDNELLFHIGASVKDAGKKTFGINTISDKEYLKIILARVSSLR